MLLHALREMLQEIPREYDHHEVLFSMDVSTGPANADHRAFSSRVIDVEPMDDDGEVRIYLDGVLNFDISPILVPAPVVQTAATVRVSDEGPQQRVICLSRNLQMNVTTAIDELKDIASFCQSAIETDNPKQVTPARKLQRQAVALRTKLEERMRPPTAQEVQNITDWQKKAREYASYRH